MGGASGRECQSLWFINRLHNRWFQSLLTQMSTHPGANFAQCLRTTPSRAMHIEANVVHTMCYVHDVHSDIRSAIQTVVFRQDLTSKLLVISLHIIMQSFASRVSNHCKHDAGALSWLKVEILKRAPTPCFGRLVRCSAHGCSFARLW